MGKRIVTTDVEIIAAVIEAMTYVSEDINKKDEIIVNYDQVNAAALDVVSILTKAPEKPSDITGFTEDDT